MESFLNLEQTPQFCFCDYVHSQTGVETIGNDMSYDCIVFMIRGNLTNDLLTLSSGQYYIFRSTDHLLFSGKAFEYFTIYFHGDYSQSKQNIPYHGSYDYESSLRYINRLLEIRNDRLAGNPVLFIEQEALFCHILSEIYYKIRKKSSEQLAKVIMNDISLRFNEKITLKQLSQKYFCSPNYIIRIFQKRYNVTPHRHIMNMRIDKAKQLLASTNKTCQQIADDCGYYDLSTFYRTFVKEVGNSPDTWRKQHASNMNVNLCKRGDYRGENHAISAQDNEDFTYFDNLSKENGNQQ